MAGSVVRWSVRPRLVSLALGSSVLALAAGASPAAAQCAPDPAIANGITVCAGIDTDGLNVPTNGTQVVVQPGATVLAGTQAAGIVTSGQISTVSVAGSVLGGATPGILATTGNPYPGPCDPYAGASVGFCPGPLVTISPSAMPGIVVAAGGVVSGGNAVRLQNNPGNPIGTVTATIENAGTLTGTSGALIAGGNTRFSRITNLAGGTIDGGSGAAIAMNDESVFQSLSIVNSGRIVSSDPAATITFAGSAYIRNDGIITGGIVSTGTGVSGQFGPALTIVNAGGATIGGPGPVAIRDAGSLYLTNAGTIDGSVVSIGRANQSTTIDIAAGTINGDLTLGAGDDSVTARFDAVTGRIGSVTGTIDAGTGRDTLNLTIDDDTTLSAGVIPASFERLGLTIDDAAVTLGAGIALPDGLTATGSGTVINEAALATNGSALLMSGRYPGTLSLVNRGSVTADLSGGYGAAVSVNIGELTNDGAITAIGGDGVRVTSYGTSALTNNGTIDASGVAALVYSGALVNAGTIRSSGGTGVLINGSSSNLAPSTNSGRIEGATSGVSISFGRFVNSGVVSGGAVGVDLTYHATVENQAGGTIDGATGISGRNGSGSTVLNAGTINGDVDFTGGFSYDQSPDIFVDNGGVTNGAIRLGGGDDLLVTGLIQPDGRGLGGARDGVDAGGGFDTIVYRVDADAAAAIALPTGFEGIGYELANDARLTLTATQRLTGLALSGTGTVDVTADISGSDRTLIDMDAPTTAQRTAGALAGSRLDMVSRGTLTLVGSDPYGFWQVAAVNVGSGTFENAGTIDMTGNDGFAGPVAIRGGERVVNSGTIGLSRNAIGVQGADNFVNTGTIAGAVGANGAGVYGVRSIDNSGSIVTDRIAIVSAYHSDAADNRIVNTGLIQSRRTRAIDLVSGGEIVNAAGGTIRGNRTAILAKDSSVINRGTIVGNVLLDSDPGSTTASYTADGGTLSGVLFFGMGDDRFVQTGATTGITGTIDGGDGRDAIILDRNGAGSFTGAVNFETLAVNAGSWTLTGAQTYADGITIAAGATAIGDGAVLNGGIANAGALVFDQQTDGGFAGAITGTGSVTKAGGGTLTLGTQAYTGATGVTGGTLVLTGTLASTDYAVRSGATLTSADAATLAVTAPTLTIANAGTIANAAARGRAIVSGGAGDARMVLLTNAAGGLITSADDAVRIDGNPGGGSIRIDNHGTIRTTAGGRAIDFDAAASGAAAIVINNHAGAVIQSFGQDAIRPGQGAIVTNAGLIRAAGAIDAAYDGIDWQERTGTVVNLETGTISGLHHGITGDGAGHVLNAGTIRADSGAAIAFGAFDDRIDNSGTITGGSGGIAIAMGAGDDVLTLIPGSVITGRVDGGAGTDRVRLAGTGSGSFAGAVDFERLEVATGTWTLTGASRLADGTAIAAGATLLGTTATLTGAIADAGTLRIDQAGDGVFDAALAGNGALVKAGSGSVTIGDQAGFTGTTTLQAGRLLLAGTVSTAMTVQSGATLGGTGTVAGVTVASGGTIAPGASLGTVTIAGNFVQQAGSIYAAEVLPTGSDRIVVGGSATLQPGARLVVTGTTGAIGTRYALLTAAGGIDGSYAVTQPTGLTGTELRLATGGNTLFASVARSAAGLQILATTGNRRALVPAFAALGTGNAAYAALTLLPDANVVANALDILTGEIHASLRTAMVRDAQIVQGTALTRLVGGDQPGGLWGTALSNTGNDDASADAAAINRDTFGGVGGFDVDAGALRAGLAGGYTRTRLSANAVTSRASVKTIQLFGYAGGTIGAVRMRGGIGYGWADNRTDRSVGFAGFSDRLRGDYDGHMLHGFAEAGYVVPLGGGSVQPFGGLQAFRVGTDGSAETGGATALTVAERTDTVAFATTGLRFETPVVHGVSARGVTAWQRRIDGSAPISRSRFTSGGTDFDIVGVSLSQDAMTAGLDVVWAPAANIRIVSSYAGMIGSRSDDNLFKLTASIGF